MRSEVHELFQQALDLSADKRREFVEQSCEKRPAIAQEVMSLLQAFEDAPESLDRPLFDMGSVPEQVVDAASDAATSGVGGGLDGSQPSRIGHFRLIERIGEGGMGIVYLAEQTEPIQRSVAIKIIKLGMNTKSVIARFEIERQALALMNHPNVARVLDAGTLDDGRPYFVMEYVQGQSITQYCDQHRLTTTARVRLFQNVCDAVQHAHHKGIIHRDIKPSNVLISVDNDTAVPKVIDFGVAKATEQRLTEKTLFTERGQLIGTPEYMSPEQAGMDQSDIDARTDIYSLGVLLYELLVGVLPFESTVLRRASLAAIQQIISDEEPLKLSTRLSGLGPDAAEEVAIKRRTDYANLHGQLRGDLDWIAARAMEKDRNRRYGTALELAADIERYLTHEPVHARAPSFGYRTGKFMRKHRTAVTLTAAVFLSLALGLVFVSIQYSRTLQARELSDERYAEIIRLADIKRLQDAVTEADALWPADPAHILPLEAWLRDTAYPLRDRLPLHREHLEQLREQAVTHDTEATRPRWTFQDDETQWQHDTFVELINDLSQFVSNEAPRGTIAEVEQRLEFARSIEAKSVAGAEAAAAWRAAIRDIAALDVYRGLKIEPQIGLVPLRRDPRSGLWEFWHIQTGARPQPNTADGAVNAWTMSADMGLVFVLVPGGTFLIGTQKDDPQGPNYDPASGPQAEPVRSVTLDPFFISKYEMTQTQWQRVTGTNPSRMNGMWTFQGDPPKPTPVHQNRPWNPIENVDWHTSTRVMARLGLMLPTEAQWEYTARAGTSTPWWTGSDRSSLGQPCAGNLPDLYTKENCKSCAWLFEDWKDGWIVHAPVGMFVPNPYGLHDTIGNVFEWCQDVYVDGYADDFEPGTGLQNAESIGSRCNRGGCYNTPAENGRTGFRGRVEPTVANDSIGVRPARRVEGLTAI